MPGVLGLIFFSSGLTWKSHVDRVNANVNRTLGFIRRNIKTKMPEMTYNSLVGPQLKYASAVWDPHTKVRISQIDKSSEELLTGQSIISIDRQV